MNSCSFFIVAAVIFFWCLSSNEAATCHPDDEAGLLAFKLGITQDPSGILSSWKKGTACCSWFGVSCFTNRVTGLTLSGQYNLTETYLSGTISPSLAKLQHLEGFHFTNLRNITGSFPQFLFQLPKLKTVYITNNGLSGPLPANIGALSQLVDLALEGNRFIGPIPSSISNLIRLVQLSLGDNILIGTIPVGIAKLKLLYSVDFGGNRLSGAIPDIFKSMANLQSLILSRNEFSGNLPPSIAALKLVLMFLDLSQNNLSGMIPNFLTNFKILDSLDLSRNKFSGVVPTSFANMPKLFHIDLSHNFLTGPFPAFKNVDGIASLDLSYNRFNLKTIPKWVTSSPSIYSLKLVKCGINMSFDHWNPMNPNIYYYVDLSENEISGSPARFLNQARNLVEFQAPGNKLRFDIGELKNLSDRLEILDLSKNLVFGKVPTIVATVLKKLNLSYNHLCGKQLNSRPTRLSETTVFAALHFLLVKFKLQENCNFVLSMFVIRMFSLHVWA